MIPTLSDLVHAGLLAPGDAALARSLARLAEVDPQSDAALAVALTCQQVRAGHVCLELADPPSLEELAGERSLDAFGADWVWPSPSAWRAALESSALVERAPDATRASPPARPLVLDADDRLYLGRYFSHERALARSLRARAETEESVDAEVLAEGLDRVFGAARGDDGDARRRAAEVAMRRRLCVVTGGPGTGKTSAVAGVLALAVEQALALGHAPPRIKLVTPTGKAAAALTASLSRALGGIDVRDEVRDAIPSEATTVHRALGALGGVGERFRHGEDDPWPVDLVVLDEASMVDLSLMRRLVDAVPEAARLVMMGDADQLASVEAGAVLGEVCGAGLDASASGPVAPTIVRLVKSHRFAADSGVGELARAVNEGDAGAAFAVLENPARADAVWIEGGSAAWPAEIEALVESGFAPFRRAQSPEAALDALERFRVLCPLRSDPRGVEAFNRRLAARADEPERGIAEEPVLVERNDHAVSLFNGDMGVRLWGAAGRDRSKILFPGPDGGVRTFSAMRVPPHSACWAMSVHKSQGSEFDEVLVSLPSRPGPLLTREMLYTALTRARERVVVWAPREVLASCIERRIERHSGLRSLLWHEPG